MRSYLYIGLLVVCVTACNPKRVWHQQDVTDAAMRSDLAACKSVASKRKHIGVCMQAKGYLWIPRSEAELLRVRSLQKEGLDERGMAERLQWNETKVSRYVDEEYELGHIDSLGRQPVDVLASLGKPGVKPLIAELKNHDPLVRRQAAEALGEIRDPRALEPLIAQLKDADALIRRHVVKALGRIRNARAVSPLIRVLNDENEQTHVRMTAAEALGRIGEHSASQALVSALQDPHWTVRSRAAMALGRIGDPRAVGPLILALKDEDALVRGRVADALGEIGDESAVESLRIALEDPDSHVRRNAKRALGKIIGGQENQ